MVLAGLGRRLTNALQSLNHTTVIDEDALKSMLKEICAGMINSTIAILQLFYFNFTTSTSVELITTRLHMQVNK